MKNEQWTPYRHIRKSLSSFFFFIFSPFLAPLPLQCSKLLRRTTTGKELFFVLFSGSPCCSIRSSGVKRVFYFRLRDSASRSFSFSMIPSPTKLPCCTKRDRTPFLINNNAQKRSRPLFSFCISSCPLLPNSNVVAGLSYKREKRQLEELQRAAFSSLFTFFLTSDIFFTSSLSEN